MTEKSRTQKYQELHDSVNEDEGTNVQSEDLSRYARKLDQFSSSSSNEYNFSQEEPQFGSRTKATDYSQSIFGNEDSYLGKTGSQQYLDVYQSDNAQIDNLLRENEELLNSTRSGNNPGGTDEQNIMRRTSSYQQADTTLSRQTPSFVEPDFEIGKYNDDENEADDFLNEALNEAKIYNMERGERSSIDTTATILSELASSRQEMPQYVAPSNVIATPKDEPLAEYASTIEDLLQPQTRSSVGQRAYSQDVSRQSDSTFGTPLQSYVEPLTQGETSFQSYMEPLTQVEVNTQTYMEPQSQVAMPTQTYIEPQVEVAPPIQTYVEPQQVEITPPIQTYVEPQVEVAPPIRTYIEPQVEVAPPIHTYIEPQVEVAPPIQTYIEPQVEIAPQVQTYIEPQVQIEPSAHAYVEQQKETVSRVEEDLMTDYFSDIDEQIPVQTVETMTAQYGNEQGYINDPVQKPFGEENANMYVVDDANASIEELTQKLEREKLFREEMLQDSRQMAMQMNEYENELTNVTKNVSRHDQVLNFVLIVCIIALFLVLFFIVYLALTNKNILPDVFYYSTQLIDNVGQKWLR